MAVKKKLPKDKPSALKINATPEGGFYVTQLPLFRDTEAQIVFSCALMEDLLEYIKENIRDYGVEP